MVLDATTRVEEWPQDYATSRDPQLRERIILAYLDLADRLASRYRHSQGTTSEDLTQTARTGLIAAVDRYDPDYGSRFVPYAVACVVGELKRYLRDTSWRLHVPVHARSKPTARSGFRRAAPASGPPPATGELAEQLEVGEEEVLEAMTALTSRWEVSLDQPAGEEPEEFVGPAWPGGQAAGAGARSHRPAVLPGPGSGRWRGPGWLLPDACLRLQRRALARMHAQLLESRLSKELCHAGLWMVLVTLDWRCAGSWGSRWWHAAARTRRH